MSVLVLSLLATAAASALPPSAGVFARVPDPGGPEGVAVGPDRRVYVATLNGEGGDKNSPSKVFAYSPRGKVLRSYRIKGQDLSATDHGLTGIAFDAGGHLYVGDLAPPRVLRLNVRTGRQTTYARLRDVQPCESGGRPGNCSAGVRDFPAWPDYPVFAADGSLYITDSLQALIWRVPRGGGRGRVFFTDPRLQSLIGNPGFGPSGMALAPNRRTLVFTTVEGPTGDGDPTAGRIWKLPISPNGRPGALHEFWVGRSSDAPDGMAFGRSGRLYVDLAGANGESGAVAVISPAGSEIARTPATPVDNAAQPIPFDTPLGMAFQHRRLLIANSAFVDGNRDAWAILTLRVGERGVPPLHPRIRR